MGSFVRFLALAGLTCVCSTAPARAQAPQNREQCVEHHEQAQDARLSGKLLAARAVLRECSSAACPALISRDCVGWLAELEPLIPSVIFRATRNGEDVVSLRIRESEQVLTESITGTALELDPGPHHFIAELPDFPPLEATYVLQAGDKRRVVRFDFSTPQAAPPEATSAPPLPAPPPPPDPTPRERPIPTLSYVLGSATVAAVVTGSVLGAISLAKRSDVEKRCAPLCREEDVRPVRQLAFAADISFVLALIGGAATTYSYATRPSVAASVSARDYRVLVGGSF